MAYTNRPTQLACFAGLSVLVVGVIAMSYMPNFWRFYQTTLVFSLIAIQVIHGMMVSIELDEKILYEAQKDYVYNLGFRSVFLKSITVCWSGLDNTKMS